MIKENRQKSLTSWRLFIVEETEECYKKKKKKSKPACEQTSKQNEDKTEMGAVVLDGWSGMTSLKRWI